MRSLMVCGPHSSDQTEKVRWTGHLAYGGKRKAYWFSWGCLKERNHMEDQVAEGKTFEHFFRR